jgi:putative ABC transport system ATP-binding protein
VTALRGPSGSGKTTLLVPDRRPDPAQRGRVRLDGRDISALPERFLTELRRATFGFVFQQFQLIRGLSVLENVMLPALPTGRPYAEVRARALQLLADFDLAARAEARAQWLSGGEAQRVAIARALINDPESDPRRRADRASGQRAVAPDPGHPRRPARAGPHRHPVQPRSAGVRVGLVERVVEIRDGGWWGESVIRKKCGRAQAGVQDCYVYRTGYRLSPA